MSAMPECLANFASYHGWLTGLEDYQGQVSFYSFFPPQKEGKRPPYEGRYAELLDRLGVQPYQQQVEALEAVAAGKHVVIATPTASGKSLSYQLPTLRALQDGGTALYLFPTKALAHDQLEKLSTLAEPFGLAGLIAAYDGDTPSAKRRPLRENAACLLSNPDMLHYGILPHHRQWARFLGCLKFIVVDELHSYRGVMGVHVANILRRLLRLARHYGASPQVIAASATIGNPAEHARNLTGMDFVAITQDSGARAARELIFWQPPELSQSEHSDGRRRSTNTEAADLAALFVRTGLKGIFFCNSRKSAELVARYARGQLPEDGVGAQGLVPYRAGYTAEDRRAIEEGFKRGDIRVLTATSALELGVDVGGVDAVVLVGYPGSLMALWQRAGRAGRGAARSLTLLIPGADPLDEYYLHHPEAITEGKIEHAVADAFNSELHPLHLACAAYEKPLLESEELVGGVKLGAVSQLEQAGKSPRTQGLPSVAPDSVNLIKGGAERSDGGGIEDRQHHLSFEKRDDKWFYRGTYPHTKISVRGLGGQRVVLKDGFDRHIGISDYGAALRDLHPGAVYLHGGESYLVRNLDLEKGVATLLPHIEDYYTQARSLTEIDILEQEAELRGVYIGRTRVRVQIDSYVRKRYFSEAVLEERVLELPDLSYNTQALWFNVAEVAGAVHPSLLPSAMHALEHALIGLLPVFVLCERADVGGVSYPLYPATGEPLIFIYDGYPGGVGYSRAGALVFRKWLSAARDLLRDCPCQNGCPRCVLSPKCGNGNQYLDKGAALALAEALLARLERIPELSIEA